MNGAMIEILILAAIAVFVFVKVRSVLGTRTGYEEPLNRNKPVSSGTANGKPSLEVIEGDGDDLEGIAEQGSEIAMALRKMRAAEPGFDAPGFLQGAKRAYEMILMAYENGDTKALRPLLDDEVYDSFVSAIEERKTAGLTVEARFIGVRDARIFSAMFNEDTREADVEIRFVGELISVVRNVDHEIVEGDPTEIRRQTDLWTFTRQMGASNPNWLLSATGG